MPRPSRLRNRNGLFSSGAKSATLRRPREPQVAAERDGREFGRAQPSGHHRIDGLQRERAEVVHDQRPADGDQGPAPRATAGAGSQGCGHGWASVLLPRWVGSLRRRVGRRNGQGRGLGPYCGSAGRCSDLPAGTAAEPGCRDIRLGTGLRCFLRPLADAWRSTAVPCTRSRPIVYNPIVG